VAAAGEEAMNTLTLTTPTHAFAYGVYGKQAGFGLALLLGATVKSLAAFVFVPVVGLALLLGGLTGLFAITVAQRRANPDPGLRLEAVAVLVLGITNFGLAVSLAVMYGPFAAIIGLTYVMGVALSCAGRVKQIRNDRARLRASLLHARPADDATLAEPPDTNN
jgi:hypothetical protein